MKYLIWTALLGASVFPVTARAQASKARNSTAARAIAASLAAIHKGIDGGWALYSEGNCVVGSEFQGCSFRDQLSPNDASAVLTEIGKSVGATPSSSVIEDVKSLRLANAEKVRALGRTVTCGDAEFDKNAVKLLSMSESRASGDTVQVRLSVTQYGSLAYCEGGSQVYLYTVVIGAGGQPVVSVQRQQHYEVMMEIPKRKN